MYAILCQRSSSNPSSRNVQAHRLRRPCMLWNDWWLLVRDLRSACARTRSFLWLCVCLAGFSIRKDLQGVTSIVRALGLKSACYDRLLDLFHSPAVDLHRLTRAWCALVFRAHPSILRVNCRPVLVGDGLKIPKAGRKMPAVQKLHQESDSHTKPDYIFGHSCQAIAVLTQAASSILALPLVARIQEGVVFSNRDHRSLLDKMVLLLDSLGLQQPYSFVADAYYAAGKLVRGLLVHGNHLVTRVRRNSVAFFPAAPPPPNRPRRRGRPLQYGKKITVASLLQHASRLQQAPSPVYGEQGVILRFCSADLLWRPVGILVRFVAVLHPQRGALWLFLPNAQKRLIIRSFLNLLVLALHFPTFLGQRIELLRRAQTPEIRERLKHPR